MEEKNWAKVENDTVGKFFGFEIEKRRTRMTRRAVPRPNHTIFSNAVIERGFVTICQSDSGLLALSKVLLTGTFSLFNWHAELCYHFTWMLDFFSASCCSIFKHIWWKMPEQLFWNSNSKPKCSLALLNISVTECYNDC